MSVILLIVSLIVLINYLENQKKEKIKKELKDYASSNNFKFIDTYRKFDFSTFINNLFNSNNNSNDNNSVPIIDLIDNNSMLSAGTIENVIIKEEDNCTVYWGDHIYTTGSGKSRHTHNCFFVAIECDDLQIPSFFVRDENAIFDYLGKLFGGQDINFSGDNDFSPKFVLQGDSESRIRSLFTAKVRRAFTYNVACSGYRIYGNMHSILIEQEKQIDNINDRIKFEQKLKNIFSVIYSELTKEEIV